MKLNRFSKLSVVLGCIAIGILLCGFSCEQSAQSAATAVNKYAESLSHFQDAEIIAHTNKLVSDEDHRRILEGEKIASKAGQDLDAAIVLAGQGADTSAYIATAEKAFADLLDVVKSTNQANLQLLAQAAGDVLQNAITLIQTIKPQKTAAIPVPHPLFGMGFLFLLGMAAMGGGITGAIALLNIASQLEPVGFDLVMKFADSLKGKSVDEIVAMNEKLFGKVDATADAELAKLDQAAQAPTSSSS